LLKTVIGMAILLPMLGGVTTVFGMAWWSLRKGRRSARAWAIAASILDLPFFGFGTLVGVAGLIVFWRRENVAKMAIQPKAPRLPGDGTSKLLEHAVQGLSILGTLAAGYGWYHWAGAQGLSRRDTLTFLMELEFASLAAIGFHELGHVVGGWISEMKLRQLILGPFEWRLHSGKWEFRFQLSGLLLGKGATGMAPTTLKNIRGRNVFMIAAGPVASLVLAGFAVLATLTAKGQPWESYWEIFALTATFSGMGFVVNLIPVRPEDLYSDGAHLYQIMSQGPWADVHLARSMVSSSLVTPLRPRDFDIQVIQRAGRFLDRGLDGMLLRLYAYLHFLDTGQVSQALAALAEAEAIYETTASQVPADLHCDFVFGNAFLKQDRVAARMWWQRMEAKGITGFKVDYWKARTALLWIENRPVEASEAWEKGCAVSQRLPAAGAYEFDRRCFVQLRQALDACAPPELPAHAVLEPAHQ
jgi:hypothetical protein